MCIIKGICFLEHKRATDVTPQFFDSLADLRLPLFVLGAEVWGLDYFSPTISDISSIVIGSRPGIHNSPQKQYGGVSSLEGDLGGQQVS